MNENFLMLASKHSRILTNYIRCRKPISCQEYISLNKLKQCSFDDAMNAFRWFLILPKDDHGQLSFRLTQLGKNVIDEAIKMHML